ncbi:DUF6318 family protein [uncultured Jatrophihabitans sp.]|uniref:DUF6318 family protein n=1 Tax=uncultured Jatrophihabitans sp. TaxID=1610747 RepID=UPI0035C971EE
MATTGPNVRPGEKPPTLERLGRLNTAAGADAYARYWMRTLDWAYATTSSAAIRNLYTSSCAGCAAFSRNIIDSTRAANEHFIGGRIVVTDSTVQANDGHAGATAVIDLTFNQTPLKVISASGRQDGEAPSIHAGTFRNWLRWTGSRWTIVDWKRAVK